MNSAGIRYPPDLPTARPGGEAVIAIASDEEKILVQQPTLADHFLSEHHAGAVAPEERLVFRKLR